MRCVFRACDTYCCLCTVCLLLSRITQDTIQPTDTASNRATSTPMPAMKVVELSVHVEFDLIVVRVVIGNCVVVIGNCVVVCTLLDNDDGVLFPEHSLRISS